MLSRDNWQPAQVEELISGLLPVIGVEAERVRLHGDKAVLDPKAAVAMTLALREPATNAMKYGALSTPDGSVDISWSGTNGSFNFEWRESGGPPVSPPRSRGFGSSMIERALIREFGGGVRRGSSRKE